MVLHDWVCMAHGLFEAETGRCPHGCSEMFTKKVFLKAPGVVSDRTKSIDAAIQGLADDYKLTDINNQNGTSACVRPDPKAARRHSEMQEAIAQRLNQMGAGEFDGSAVGIKSGADTSGLWGNLPVRNQDGTLNTSAIPSLLSANRLQGDNLLAPVMPALKPPTPMVVGRDNSKIDVGGSSENSE